MSLPFESLTVGLREVGLVVAVLLGFGFGFVLERAGFGRSTKLAAQFYLYDMTVFKVMFGAIVTAMLGIVALSGFGIVDIAALSTGAVSETFIWPMAIGGFLLGAGFITSGYCPGTSLVATASGNLDGLATIAGVIVGSVIFAESYPYIETFHLSSPQGHMFLYELMGLQPVGVALIITVVAVAAFIGAEKVEKIMTQRIAVAKEEVDEELRSARAPRRFAFGLYGIVGLITAGTLFFPVEQNAEASDAKDAPAIDAESLARLVFDEPWTLRIIDVRDQKACFEQRVPGSECVPRETLGDVGLAFGKGTRDLIIINGKDADFPAEALAYPGNVFTLAGGFSAWKSFALTAPEPLSADASAQAREAYGFRAAVNQAMTGRKAAPPPAAPTQNYTPKKKKKGGGCS